MNFLDLMGWLVVDLPHYWLPKYGWPSLVLFAAPLILWLRRGASEPLAQERKR